MSGRYRVHEVVLGRRACYYELRRQGADIGVVQEFMENIQPTCSSTDRLTCSSFYKKCSSSCMLPEYLTELWQYLREVAPRKTGFQARTLKGIVHTKAYEYPLGTVQSGPIRVFGLLLGAPDKRLFLATGAATKFTRTIQEDETLTKLFEQSKEARNQLRRSGIGVEETLIGSLRLSKKVEDVEITL